MTQSTASDLTHHKLYVSKDGLVGVAISPEDDIQNVFNNGGPKGAGTAAVKWAISQGGHAKFNRQYAPATWDHAKYGELDFVFMRLKS